jgi:uncharacterized membrane protein
MPSDLLGLFHTGCALAAVVLGFIVIVRRKGGRFHRRLGFAYFVAMVLMNVTAFMIYDLFGRFGPFHWLAVVSLVTVVGAFVPAWLRRPARWLYVHAYMMTWSYAGLIAALVSEIGTRTPGARFEHVIWAGSAVILIAAVLIYGRVPRLVKRLRAGQSERAAI